MRDCSSSGPTGTRTSHRGHRLSDILGDLRRERLFDRILLRGLEEENVGSIVNGWAGVTAPGQEFTRRPCRDGG